jgi:HlyD family secretion protein
MRMSSRRGSVAAALFVCVALAQTKGGIGCLGRIEPEDGVIRVTAPYVDGAPAVIDELKARENTRVTRGQVLAVLHGGAAVEASVREAAARVEAARKRVAQAKEPPKQGDIEARSAAVRRLELELQHAREELARYETLRKTEDVSVADVEARRTVALTAERAVEEARQSLRGFQEMSASAMELAEAELKVAIAAEQRAAAARANTVVRAPATGTVLRIHAHAGEQVGPEGLLELAKTDRMYVIAEVYESDVRRVHAGQAARITGEMLGGPLTGKVERVGAMIARSEILPTNPAAFSDTRVVPVHILLTDPTAAARLIHGKVSVVIEP